MFGWFVLMFVCGVTVVVGVGSVLLHNPKPFEAPVREDYRIEGL